MPTTSCSLRQRRQAGVVLVEFAISLGLLLSVVGIVLQTGRTALMYNAVFSATHGAVFYLATAPDTELVNGSQAKATAKSIATKILKASATDTNQDPVVLNYLCAPSNLRAPCLGSSMPSYLSVTLDQNLNDVLMSSYTFAEGIDIVNMESRSKITITRVGFM